jgi:TorA maturation chaperone TorD
VEQKQRVYIYAFLSRVYANVPDNKLVLDLLQTKELLEMISSEALLWFENSDIDTLEEELNIDFSSLFLMNSLPIESSILDDKEEVLIGLQNPVMQFYFSHGYDLNLIPSKVQAPDHISIECGFMQNLIQKDEIKVQATFLENHLLTWAPIYFLSLKEMAKTPFFRDLCDFTAEFLISDYDYLMQREKRV